MAKKIPKQKSKESVSITYSEPFSAVIVDGGGPWKNKLQIVSREFYQHQINKFKVGTKVTIEIHTRKAKRSDQQNRYYWGVYLPLIAKETGNHNLDALHTLFSSLFLTEKVVEVMGRKVRIKKSTTALSVSEFIEYIMNIEAETGVEAPPTENYGLSPIRESNADIEYPEDDIGPSLL